MIKLDRRRRECNHLCKPRRMLPKTLRMKGKKSRSSRKLRKREYFSRKHSNKKKSKKMKGKQKATFKERPSKSPNFGTRLSAPRSHRPVLFLFQCSNLASVATRDMPFRRCGCPHLCSGFMVCTLANSTRRSGELKGGWVLEVSPRLLT